MCDQGDGRHNDVGSAKVQGVRHIPRNATRAFQRQLRRRSAIEPSIGHMKSDNRLDRNHLTGKADGRINAWLAAVGYNFRKLLRGLFLRSSGGWCADFPRPGRCLSEFKPPTRLAEAMTPLE